MIFKKDSRILEEYEILKEDLEITSIGNSSLASVKIVFRRRIEYHITNTLLQVIIKVTHQKRLHRPIDEPARRTHVPGLKKMTTLDHVMVIGHLHHYLERQEE